MCCETRSAAMTMHDDIMPCRSPQSVRGRFERHLHERAQFREGRAAVGIALVQAQLN